MRQSTGDTLRNHLPLTVIKQSRDYRVPSLPVPVGKFRNIYQAVAKSIHVDDLFVKMLVNHKLTDMTHGYAGQRSVWLDTLIAGQERITEALRVGCSQTGL